jgi:hypothetical protein
MLYLANKGIQFRTHEQERKDNEGRGHGERGS